MNALVKFSALGAAALLAACGGGSSSQPVDPRVAQVSGHWVACGPDGSGGSRKSDLQITGLGGLRSHAVTVVTLHAASTDCSSSPVKVLEEDTETTLIGESVTISGVSLDKFTQVGQIKDYSQGSTPTTHASPAKGAAGVIKTNGTDTLRVGDNEINVDPDGYPTMLFTDVYVKQPS